MQSATYLESPLWQTSIREGTPDTMEGKHFVLNQDMESLHPTYRPVLFADFKRFAIREVLPLKIIRLDERFADTDETAFAILERYDSKLLTPSTAEPAVYIRNATT